MLGGDGSCLLAWLVGCGKPLQERFIPSRRLWKSLCKSRERPVDLELTRIVGPRGFSERRAFHSLALSGKRFDRLFHRLFHRLGVHKLGGQDSC